MDQTPTDQLFTVVPVEPMTAPLDQFCWAVTGPGIGPTVPLMRSQADALRNSFIGVYLEGRIAEITYMTGRKRRV